MIIEIKDGSPINFPILLDNFRLAFPDEDLSNLSSRWAWVIDNSTPTNLADDEEFDLYNPTYRLDEDGFARVVWNITKKSAEKLAEELAEKTFNAQNALTNQINGANQAYAKGVAGETNSDVLALWETYKAGVDSIIVPDVFSVPNFPPPPRKVTTFNVAHVSGVFEKKEKIYQSDDGLIDSFSSIANITQDQDWETWSDSCSTIKIAFEKGSFVVGQTIYGDKSNAQCTLVSRGDSAWLLPDYNP